MSYSIGSPSMTSSQYVFDEDKPCGYEETVTVTGMPNFMTHNEDTSDFTIASNPDLSLIGSYTVTV